jgi:hypothetical protein
VNLLVDTDVSEEHSFSILGLKTNIDDKNDDSVVKMEAVYSSETLISTYKSTRRYYQKTNIDIFTAVRTSN